MDIPITLPLDSDGFLRRECPHCEQQFKWHSGPANAEAEDHATPPSYHCPFCGQPAGPDSWWTSEQGEYAEGVAAPAALSYMQDELADAFRGNKYITFESGGAGDLPDQPHGLTEPDDMEIVTSPCHAYEPVKVPDSSAGPFHCLICGALFST